MDAIIEAGLNLLVTVVLSLIAILSGYAVHYIRVAASALKERTKLQVSRELLGRVELLATTAVTAAEATTAKELRKAVKEGSVGREELLQVGIAVKNRVMEVLGVESRAILADTVGDVERYVSDLVEVALERLKKSDATS